MKTIVVRNIIDFLSITSNSIVHFESGFLQLPEPTPFGAVVFRNLENVIFKGGMSPKKRVCLSGYPIQFIDCKNLTFEKIAFRLTRPPGKDPARYEKWWSSPRFLSTTANATTDITFIQCSFSGNTDEIAIRPADGVDLTTLAASRIAFDRCVFGRSLMNHDPVRGQNHNFGLAATRVDRLVVFKSIFGGHHRRLIQLQGKGCKVGRCLFVDGGTMFVGLHAGSEARFTNNGFIRGIHNVKRTGFIAPVVDTSKSMFQSLGGISIALDNKVLWQPDSQPISIELEVVLPPVLNPVRHLSRL